MILAFQGKAPEISEEVFIAPDAYVIGNVSVGKGSSIWFGCLIRGDVERIEIGSFTNIQDHSVIHVTGGKYPTIIGNHVTLGHRATVHGAILRDYAFVGIGATVLDGCEMGEFSILAAGSLLPPGKVIPDGMLAMGIPAKVVRPVTDEEKEMILRTQEKYYQLAQEYRKMLGDATQTFT